MTVDADASVARTSEFLMELAVVNLACFVDHSARHVLVVFVIHYSVEHQASQVLLLW